MVLGDHAARRGIYGPALTYTCRPRKDGAAFDALLTAALDRLPAGIFAASAESKAGADEEAGTVGHVGTAADGATIKEGSYLVGAADRLMQIVDGEARSVAIKEGKAGDRNAKVIRALLPIRDAVREVLRAQAADQPWAPAQVRLRIAYAASCAASGRSTIRSSRSRPTRRPARSGRRIAARTWRRSPTIPIAGWSPASRITTWSAASPAWGRSSASG